jgi:hypothetical protein
MITPKEIQKQCSNWWKNVLKAYIESIVFFPKEINRIGRITSKDILEKLPEYQKALELLRSNSKSHRKIGYSLVEAEQQFDKIGRQIVPKKIIIETLDDYLNIIEKEKEYQIFTENCKLLLDELPDLREWVILYPQKLIKYNWSNIIEACKFLIENPKVDLYTREFPIQVPTKFIEENEAIIDELLYALTGEHIQLKYPEPLIRFRVLDEQISHDYFSENDDLSIPISQFEKLNLPLKKVFIVENKTNVLTFPIVTEAVVIFGSGYGVVNILKSTSWLNNTELFYWGDLDIHGFEILSQFKNHFSHVKSILMDETTFKQFENARVEGKPSNNFVDLTNLTDEEQQLYLLLKENNWRLEQEKIRIEYVKEFLEKSLIG